MGSPSTPSAPPAPATPATPAASVAEPWRKDLDSGAQLSIWSASGGCWTLGKIIDASAERLKVDYVVGGERVEKTVLRESPHLRQAPPPQGPPGPGYAKSSPQQAVVRPWHPVPMQLPPVPVAPLTPGQLRLADLQIGQMLGSGGFGSVHRGMLRGYPKEVAIKKLHVMGGVSKEQVAEFYKEVANLQALRHERLIQLIGIACEMPLLCIVTELAAGGSLHDLLHVKRVMLQEAQKLRLILQMTEGVMFLHGQRPPFVHRDLKSANVVLDAELNAKLCDLGITERMERTHISKRDAEAGSPRYMSPELFHAPGKLTEKMDLWALGCLAVEVLTTRVPHEGCINVQQVATKLLVTKEPPFTDDWWVPFHPEVKEILSKCFEWNPVDRPSAAKVFEVFSALPRLAEPP